jgi:hypothetical protein
METLRSSIQSKPQTNADKRGSDSRSSAFVSERWAKTSTRRKAAGVPFGAAKVRAISSVFIRENPCPKCFLRVFVVFFGCGLRLRCVSVIVFVIVWHRPL